MSTTHELLSKRAEVVVAFNYWTKALTAEERQGIFTEVVEKATTEQIEADLQVILEWMGIEVEFDRRPELIGQYL